MRLRQLECFVKTCELGSINRAADQLHLAQPALGLQIKNLEHDFGVTLLVRTPRGVSPTPAGEIMLEWARDVLQSTRVLRDRLKASANSQDEELKLALTPSTTALIAAPVLVAVGDRLPKLTLRVLEGLSHIAVDWVESDRVDLALISGMSERSSLTQTPLLREQLYYVGAGEQIGQGPISFTEVLSASLAMPGENDALRVIVENGARSIDVPLTVKYEISSVSAIKDLVSRRVASTILPFSAIRQELKTGLLSARLIVDPPLSRTLVLVRRAGREPSALEGQLVSVIMECLAHLLLENADARPGELLAVPGVLSPTG
jgi:LysR family transcriptional regulator, nitrogen assimilation regulatory protein